MENKWISPALLNLEPVQASDMVVENPRRRFDTPRTVAVGQLTAARRLFSTEHSPVSHSVAQLTLDDVASAMYPECPNAVAFRYAFAEHEAQYQPYADVNVGPSIDCETAMHSAVAVDLVSYGKQFASANMFVMPQYSMLELKQVEEQTRHQADSPLWHLARNGRISASVAHDVVVRTKKLADGKLTNPQSLLSLILDRKMLDDKLPALKYGRENEEEAVMAYIASQRSNHIDLKVETCGLFIDQQQTYLCATPDRTVACSCCGSGLLEVKCPLSSAGIDPKDARLPYLARGDSGLMLRRTHKYFTQVQMQMAIAKRQWCEFFVYSKSGHFLQRVTFDEEFWNSCKDVLASCFYSYVVPMIVCNTDN